MTSKINNDVVNSGEGTLESSAVEQKISELEILRQSLEEANQRTKQLYDQFLRLGAEFDNYRKRTDQRLIDVRRNGQEDVLTKVVELCDILEHGEDIARTATDVSQLKEGMTLIKQQFEKFLTERNVTPIPALGETLDPHLHEVLLQEENADKEDNVITEVIQKGYLFQDRVLRPAKVKVSVKPKI